MSAPSVKLEVSPGYQKQYINPAPTGSGDGYIKEKVLKQWLKDNEAKVGTEWDYAILDGVIVLSVKTGGQLSDGDIADLQKRSNSRPVQTLFDDDD